MAGTLLAPIGALIGRITLARMGKTGARVPATVICIGNPTVGGAGKTPTAILVLERLAARGARPFALLRGHGGREAGPLLVAGHDAAAVGDEAVLLAAAAPTIVARDRAAGARLAVSLGASHIVMDDGFQNPALEKDAALLVVDGEAGLGNGRVLPAGPLRAPYAAQRRRADALLVIGDGSAGDLLARGDGLVLRGRLVPRPGGAEALAGRRLLAFAGIGRPEKFFTSLRAIGCDLVETRAFPDHYPYTLADIQGLLERAVARDLRIVTTAKDFVRLSGPAFAEARAHIHVLPVGLVLEQEAGLDRLIDAAEARRAETEAALQPSSRR
ncbi:tetraacyldisaccharide 4'-kinase [Aquabacter spiritensis]|uniref:tetraacyldisaccharide 4'-kinase n=1 Tax=Aquabacter spiritensis TaxID=933073 RepID=UPI003083EE4B